MRARQCIWPNRVQHCFVYGLVFRFRLLSTPPLNDAVTFSYGQASVPVRKGLSPFCWCVLSGAHVPGDFVPGYDRTVPPGQKPFARRRPHIKLALMGLKRWAESCSPSGAKTVPKAPYLRAIPLRTKRRSRHHRCLTRLRTKARLPSPSSLHMFHCSAHLGAIRPTGWTLCAMLYLLRLFLRPEAAVLPIELLWAPTQIPLCDLCGLCAMLSPLRLFLARKPRR
jgi:hypothetical protein